MTVNQYVNSAIYNVSIQQTKQFYINIDIFMGLVFLWQIVIVPHNKVSAHCVDMHTWTPCGCMSMHTLLWKKNLGNGCYSVNTIIK